MAPGRAFIAIYPPTPVVERLSELDRTDSGVRWVPAHQWHVTVRFLGDRVDVDRVDEHLRTTFRHSQVEASLGPAVGHFGCEILHVPVVGVEALATAVDEALVPLVGPRRGPSWVTSRWAAHGERSVGSRSWVIRQPRRSPSIRSTSCAAS